MQQEHWFDRRDISYFPVYTFPHYQLPSGIYACFGNLWTSQRSRSADVRQVCQDHLLYDACHPEFRKMSTVLRCEITLEDEDPLNIKSHPNLILAICWTHIFFLTLKNNITHFTSKSHLLQKYAKPISQRFLNGKYGNSYSEIKLLLPHEHLEKTTEVNCSSTGNSQS